MPLSSSMRAALFMTISMASFTLTDAMTKYVSASMNVGEIMFIRGVFATLFISLLSWHQGLLPHLRMALHPFVLIRIASELVAALTFLSALIHLPLANVSAILQALPLAVAMGAALVLGETVGWRRWLSIAVGFAGVAIIVRPGPEGFNIYALLALLCVLACTVRDLATKRIPHDVPVFIISMATMIAITTFGAILITPMGGWTKPELSQVMFLAVAAGLMLVGYQFIIMALRAGDLSFVAPFRYTNLLFAIILGFVVFGDIPDLPMIIGGGIIVATGLYTLYRERVVGRSQAASESVRPTMRPDGP